jgi:hypothetical protein
MTLTQEQIHEKAVSMGKAAIENNWQDAVLEYCTNNEIEEGNKIDDYIDDISDHITQVVFESENNARQYSPFEYFAYDMNVLVNDDDLDYDPWDFYGTCQGEFISDWLEANEVEILEYAQECINDNKKEKKE